MYLETKTPAKINAFLKITGKDEVSGMHYIESLMIPVNLYDVLKIKENPEFEIETSGINEVIPKEKNIIFKAFNSFKSYINMPVPDFKIILEKSIPTGAGLGGGSSNAAGFIMFLNKYLGLDLSLKRLNEIASSVGSDVPFFLCGSPAFISGKGEIVEPVKLERINKYLLLLYPEIIVNTRNAYALFDKKKLTKSGAVNINSVRQTGTGSLKDWTKSIFNDFEDVIFEEYPLLADVRNRLMLSGAEKVFMSGSGSSLIAIFGTDKARENALDEFSDKFATVRKIELLTG
ncbi:MAG TPA: 4-(cytidine 5'-diphospho)-2-C-methyl-D-erythritol kinase [bacterium]|nr:4-(cytidine 5'-diphospho)-2-C-methyl-D-erythritol kinase [bacterium]HQO92277.1 4-(cytidine 5'-diphospho)-2-C-methyl-D-erythritol kinase [bacterium]